MLSRSLNQINQSPWARLVWAGVCVLALLQVVAFYKLCTSQVAHDHARETMAVEQRNALTDCLDYMNSSTISSCVRHAADSRGAADDAGSLAARDMPQVRPSQAVLGSVVPVSYVFH